MARLGRSFPAKSLTRRADLGPVYFDNVSNSVYEAALSTYNWSHTVGTNSNRLLIVGVGIFASGTVSSITLGAQNFTFLRTDTNGVYRSELWYLVAPNTGAGTITVNLSGSLTSIAGATSYWNANQAAPDANNGGNGTNTPGSASVTPVNNNARIYGNLVAQSASGITAHAGTTPRYLLAGALGTNAAGEIGTILAPASTTLQWDGMGALDSWAISLAAVVPPQGGNSATIAQVAATATSTGGTQAVATVQKVAITQVAATVTATGGTQTVATVRNSTIAQIAATVTAAGGTQTIATVNNVALAQPATTITATGGTQVVAATSSVNATVAQVAASVTASGGTQAVNAQSNTAITQVAATLTAAGGNQAVNAHVSAGVTQVAAQLTLSGGTQAVTAVSYAIPIQDTLTILSFTDTIGVSSHEDSLIVASRPEDNLTVKSFADTITIRQGAVELGVSSASEDTITVISHQDSIVIV